MVKITKRRRRKLPEILTQDEQRALIAALQSSDYTQLRNLCMVHLMLDCGLRSAEVVHLCHRELELSSGRLTVRNGKGGRDRVLGLPKQIIPTLTDFIQYFPDAEHKPDDWVFVTASGKPVSTRFLRTMCEWAGQRAGFNRRLHPHLLRHTCASDLLRAGHTIFLVSKVLGHADISTTQIYLHLVDGELENAMEELRNGR